MTVSHRSKKEKEKSRVPDLPHKSIPNMGDFPYRKYPGRNVTSAGKAINRIMQRM